MHKPDEVVNVSLIPVGVMRLVTDEGGSLELLRVNGEPCVVVDGCYVVPHAMLARELVPAISRLRGQHE
jgi:hypothetical protein